jgi:uncharacterized protein YjiS (DUF1127 family)
MEYVTMNEAMEQMALRAPAVARTGKRNWLWRRLAVELRVAWNSWKTQRALEHLDDRMLRDIGVDRCEIASGAYRLARDRSFSDRR